MAGMCCGIVGDSDASPVEPSTIGVRRRRMESFPTNIMAADIGVAPALQAAVKRQKKSAPAPDLCLPRECENANGSCFSPPPASVAKELTRRKEDDETERRESACHPLDLDRRPKFGATSVRGRRREMEDAVSIHPFLCGKDKDSSEFHFYGVFDGHGCSHVAMRCKARMHAIIKEEIEKEGGSVEWEPLMKRSFERMDKEVAGRPDGLQSCCRCELQSPQCDAVGSTAVVAIVTPEKIIVSNCGDSRAVLHRGGVVVPLSSDHKPDRSDELERIQAAGGRVIYWDGARVLGVLAMSRAIGDNYLKPYVIPEPEVTVTDRADASCLILASDGLWDVVSNETATGVARMCISAERPPSPPSQPGIEVVLSGVAGEGSDHGCLDASMLLTKLALARHSADNVSVLVVDLRSKNL